ncbi:hypothetical protein BJY00DRAFT_167460 [Aspergillus carlsbadensis]|nr:hypothetical protein BJY00DRAFT_167460 [Aspergillus carlsbadensis]
MCPGGYSTISMERRNAPGTLSYQMDSYSPLPLELLQHCAAKTNCSRRMSRARSTIDKWQWRIRSRQPGQPALTMPAHLISQCRTRDFGSEGRSHHHDLYGASLQTEKDQTPGVGVRRESALHTVGQIRRDCCRMVAYFSPRRWCGHPSVVSYPCCLLADANTEQSGSRYLRYSRSQASPAIPSEAARMLRGRAHTIMLLLPRHRKMSGF